MNPFIKSLVSGVVLGVTMMSAGVAMAVTSSISTVSGKPYVGGTSAFDWTNWSYSDAVVTNNAATNRTWTIQVPLYDVGALTSHTVTTTSAGSTTSSTCTQLVANNGGTLTTRYAATSSACTPAMFAFANAQTVSVPANGLLYVNAVVGANGGSVYNVTYTQ